MWDTLRHLNKSPVVILSINNCMQFVYAQNIDTCGCEDVVAELQQSIRIHNEHIFHLNRFQEHYHFNWKTPEDVLIKGSSKDLDHFLNNLNRSVAQGIPLVCEMYLSRG